jgi:hypothetical protein
MTTPHDIGIPVQGVIATAPFAGEDGAGRPCLYTVMGQESGAGLFLLQVNPETGACERFSAPAGFTGARPSLWSSRWKKVFMAASKPERPGASGCGSLLAFDPVTKTVADLGSLHPTENVFPCSLAEAPDGSLYIGSYGRCHLARYRPGAGSLEQLGRLDETDQYLYAQCGDDGAVACLVKMARPHVELVDPVSGTHRTVGPVADTQSGTGRVDLYKGADGFLYVDSHEGVLRLQGGAAVPVAERPARAAAAPLPDGSTFRWIDGNQHYLNLYRTIEVTGPGGKRRALRLEFEAGGSGVYVVRPGRDGKLYGSSALPLHFFSYDIAGNTLTDHGSNSVCSGQTYSMDWLDGKLYSCAYTHGVLSVYDPSRPYTFGRLEGSPPGLRPLPRQLDPVRWLGWPVALGHPSLSNPCVLGRMDGVAFRPRDMVAGPGGKVWVASVPDYGMWGGTLSWYDPRTDTFGGAHRDLLPACSPYSLTYVPEAKSLVVGFCIHGGSGTRPKAERAGLVFWNPEQDQERERTDLGLEIIGVMDLEYAGQGLAYAVVHVAPENALDAKLVLFDTLRHRIVSQADLSAEAGWPLEVSFQRDAHYLYGATRSGIYRVKLGTCKIELLWRAESEGPEAGGALAAGRYFFGTGPRLRALDVPGHLPGT